MREREMVILRTCARCGCEYEWGVHVMVFADRAGLTRDQVRSLTHGQAGDPCWTTGRDRVLIRVVDALHDTGDVDDDLWSTAREVLDEPQMLDLLMLCGWYHAISFAGRAARVEPEAGAPRFADLNP
jgi:alkylhydroperoxidase family enzyme